MKPHEEWERVGSKVVRKSDGAVVLTSSQGALEAQAATAAPDMARALRLVLANIARTEGGTIVPEADLQDVRAALAKAGALP